MAYGTVAELRQMLPQVPDNPETNTLLATLLDRATGIVDGELKFSFATFGEAAAKDVRCDTKSGYLFLPSYKAGSVTEVKLVSGRGTTTESTEAITDYVAEEDQQPYALWRGAGWVKGSWYRVTAQWGHGAAPDEVTQVTLELAVNLWRGRDRGMFSDVIGVEGGGAVGYARALTNQQRMVLANVRAAHGELGFA